MKYGSCMPELAEVEYYRRRWNPGLGGAITAVHLAAGKRVFRGADTDLFQRLRGKRLEGSRAAGKQMLFQFSGGYWLGIHLGMSGEIRVQPADYAPARHDHLVLFQKVRALVFNDPRQFGRVRIERGSEPPAWWREIGPAVNSRGFTFARVGGFLSRHGRLPAKAALLDQRGFPGIGNWMADEILWRAGVAPGKRCMELSDEERKALWRQTRFVAREALARISRNFGALPGNWLFHQRWERDGVCPKHRLTLSKAVIGGRTTAWCPGCQK